MPSLNFHVPYYSKKTIEISNVRGADGWQVMVDNFLWATATVTMEGLRIYPNQKCSFSGDDLAGIADRIWREWLADNEGQSI